MLRSLYFIIFLQLYFSRQNKEYYDKYIQITQFTVRIIIIMPQTRLKQNLKKAQFRRNCQINLQNIDKENIIMKREKSQMSNNLLQEAKVKGFHRQFQIIDSPQIITRMSELRHSRSSTPQREFHLQQLLQSKRGPTVKKINYQRQTYRQIKQKIGLTLTAMKQKDENLTFGQVLVWKQEILASFMNEYLCQIGKECKQKADILLFIWNSVFNIIQYLFQIIGKMNHREQKQYLNNILDNHKSYQSVIDSLKQKIVKKQQQFSKQQEFIRALVYNLRYKRKQIKKISKNLKMCTFRLNQIKDFYLDLQLQHIQLLSQNRDISKQNARNLLKRKQEINHQKRKQYKLKQSHKRIRFQIQTEILNQNENQAENVSKLNDQLQTTFKKYYDKNKINGKNISYQSTQNIFENALDDFNIRIQQVPQTQSLIDFKNNTAFMDTGTDMADFIYDVEEKHTQITFNDRLFEDMVSHAAVQTQDIKQKQKQLEEKATQVCINEMKNLKLIKVKVYDRSFLLEDYRDKRYKNERGIGHKLGSDWNLASSKQIHYLQNAKKSMRIIGGGEENIEMLYPQQHCSTKTQTQNISILNTANIPIELRNLRLQIQIIKYFQKMNIIIMDGKETTDQQLKMRAKPFKSRKHSSAKSGKVLFNSGYSLFQQDSHQSLSPQGLKSLQKINSTHSKMNSRSKLSTSRSIERVKYRMDMDNISKKDNIQLNKELKNQMKRQFQSIEQNNYEDLLSKDIASKILQKSQVGNKQMLKEKEVRKFWVMKPSQSSALNKKKEKFLNDLNKGDQLLSKTSLHCRNQHFLENKRILAELQKLSQQIQCHNGGFQLIQQNANDNMNILRQELRKMLLKKRNSRRLATSRQQSLCRIISFVYTYAYHLYFNHKKSLQNLIIPLFHHFKIGYGQIKKNDLYLRMLYFLSQTICHQHEYYIFQSFILFLGLNVTGDRQLRVGHDTTCLYLKLLQKLSINFRFPLNVQQLYTTVQFFNQKCKQILIEQHYEENIIEKIIERVKAKFSSLANRNQVNQGEQNNDFGQTKLNVFKCCELIIEQIEKIKGTLEQGYLNLLQYFSKKQQNRGHQFLLYVIKNSYFTKLQYWNKIKNIQNEVAKAQKSNRWFSSLINIFMRINMPDFDKIYFIALSKYKIKQQFLYLSLNRRLNFVMSFIKQNQSQFAIQHQFIQKIINKDENNMLKQAISKKIMALAYLRIVQFQSQKLLNDLIGCDLKSIYSLQLNLWK